MATCRLIIEGEKTDGFAKPGVLNMAIDEAMLMSAAQDGISTLRFYGWQPTLSLGYFQAYSDREAHIASQSCDLVRRASGGGAILHHHELTYSFAAPNENRFGPAQHYYLAFHESLVELLGEHGVNAQLHRVDDGLTDDAFLCFQRRAENDIVCDGFKICGSAQRRWKNGLLQHGSILLEKSPYAPELPGLRELAAFDTPISKFVDLLLEKLGSQLNVEFTPGHLTDKENEQLGQLCSNKFSTDAWNRRR